MLIQKKNPKTIYKFLSSYHQIGDLIMLPRSLMSEISGTENLIVRNIIINVPKYEYLTPLYQVIIVLLLDS